MSVLEFQMAKKIVGIILILDAIAVICLFGLAFLAALAGASEDCPSGNQCSDAKRAVLIGAMVVTAGFGSLVAGVRILAPNWPNPSQEERQRWDRARSGRESVEGKAQRSSSNND